MKRKKARRASKAWTLPDTFWKFFLPIAALAGLLLRVLGTQDMEYKEDEQFHFTISQVVGSRMDWPWLGINSGVYLPNPGASVWVFVLLAKLTGATTATGLAHGVQIVGWLGILMLLPYLWACIPRDQRAWGYWAVVLAMVNPITLLYHRKLWPEAFLPGLAVLILWGFARRQNRRGAFTWGLIGALIGQVHMSGFFLAGALFAWTALFERRSDLASEGAGRSRLRTHWKGWLLGSCLGALPLIPWISWVATHPRGGPVSSGMGEALQLKYWVFWLSDSLGLHVGNALGVHRGPGLKQLEDFLRYPLLGQTPTYLSGVAHLLAAGLGGVALAGGLRLLVGRLAHPKLKSFTGALGTPWFEHQAAFLGAGLLLTLTGVWVRRYYLAVMFPWETFWLVAAFWGMNEHRPSQRGFAWALPALWVAQLVMSVSLVQYVHRNEGAPLGDYGPAYHRVLPTLKNPSQPWEPGPNGNALPPLR